jgi:hypothetical protein
VSQAAPADRKAWDDLQRGALIAGAAGLALCALGAFLHFDRFCQAWLTAFLYWLALPLGGVAILMLHNQTGGRWGMPLRRVSEAASATLPLLALYFLPVALGVSSLYVWAEPEAWGYSGRQLHELHHKAAFLNVPFFLIRAAFYFALWLGIAFRLYLWSKALDERWDPVVARKAQVFSGPGLAVYALTVTFAAIDWIMSLETFWYSSIFGAMIAAAQLLPALAFGVAAVACLTSREPYPPGVATPTVWNDLGNLMLAFVMIWSYLTFSQFFLIWSGNLPEEIVWYKNRIEGGWEWLGWALIVFYFALPFLCLLMRDLKRRPQRLVWVAAAILGMHYVYTFWLVIPSFDARGAGAHEVALFRHDALDEFLRLGLDLAALVGQGGIWLAAFLWLLRSRPLLPLTDPALQEEEAAHHD